MGEGFGRGLRQESCEKILLKTGHLLLHAVSQYLSLNRAQLDGDGVPSSVMTFVKDSGTNAAGPHPTTRR